MEASPKYKDRESILSYLKEKNIDYKLMEHEELETVQKGLDHFEKVKPEVQNYTFLKNLFLKNKAGGYYLFTVDPKSNSDFKLITKILKAKSGNIRQAEEDKLKEYLHVSHGSVGPLSLLNLSENQIKDVQFYFDKAIETEYIGIHPLINTSTIFVKKDDILKLIEENGIKVNLIDLVVEQKDQKENKPEQKKEQGKDEKKEKKDKKEKGKQDKKDKQGEKDTKAKDNEEEDLSILGIVNKKEENFSDWYSEVITKAELIEYYEISGCYILRPWAYQIWEYIQKYLDGLIKSIGIQNCYFPMFVSQAALYKEKEHVEGFSPEVAWVTKSGSSDIVPPIAIRPTSETIMYPAYAKWIRSHRDLPFCLNQWTNIVRWEFSNPTPFIRTREFLWQEGHTAHATLEEADKMVFKILDFYRSTYEDLLSCPVIPGKKSENEKFPGALYTTTIETLIPSNGKSVQCATSHNLGQNFSKMFKIIYLDKEKNKQFVWQTSWGFTTRSIGVMIMMHADNKGLVLPPKVSPIQVVIVPIKTSKDDPKLIQEKGEAIYEELKNCGVRVKFDDTETHTPGWKYAQWELKGVPIRIEYGKRDLSNGEVTIFCRDTKEKFTTKIEGIKETILKYLDIIQKRMFEKIKKEMGEKTVLCENFNDFAGKINGGNMVKTPWCKDPKCEDEVKIKFKQYAEQNQVADTVGTCKTLCMPMEQEEIKEGTKCFNCGKDASLYVLWGRSY